MARNLLPFRDRSEPAVAGAAPVDMDERHVETLCSTISAGALHGDMLMI
jgi:hypothetical protein